MAEEETRKVTILWQVELDRESLAGAQRGHQQAIDKVQGAGSAGAGRRPVGNAKAAADLNKIAQAAERTNKPIASIGSGMANAATGAKKLAEQAQSVIGKVSGMAGAYGLVLAAIGSIAVATIEWAVSHDEIDKKLAQTTIHYEQMVAHYDEIATNKASQRALINEHLINQAATKTEFVEQEALELEHVAKLLEIEGVGQQHVNLLLVEALELRRANVGEATKEGKAITRQIEILQAQAAKPKARGGSGPSEADRLRATGEGRIQLLNDEIALAQSLYELNGTADASALDMLGRRREAKLAELQLERQVLDATRAKNSVEREQIGNRQAQIDREMALASVDAMVAKKRLENEEAARGLDLARAKQEIEGRATGRIIDLADARISRSIEQAKLDNDGARVHQLTLVQLGQQAATREKLLDLRERELLISNPTEEIDKIQRIDDLAQVAHDREIARLESGLAVQRTVAAEEARLAEEKEARIQRYTNNLNEAIGAFEQIQGTALSVVSDFTGRQREVEDEALENWKENLEARTESQAAALDRQIEQAKGNASLRRDLERKKASLEKVTQKQIEAAENAHNEKRKRSEMRFQGVMLLVQAAVQTAKAAAAYPVVPSMIAHGVAAGINAAYGIALLSGNVPGAGGAGASGGGGSTGTAPSASDRGSTEVNRVPESVGGRAAERQGSRGRTVGGQSGNVTFQGNVTINALGSIDEDAATKIGMAVNQGKHIREGAAIK